MSRKTRRNKRRKQKSLMSPDVAVTIAVATPEEKKGKAMGGSMMVPPEREPFQAGALVSLLKKIVKPLSPDQMATRPATRGQAAYAKDLTGAIVVAGGLGYAANSDKGQSVIQAADAGEIDVEIKNPDERINPDDFPTYEKGSDSANAFQEAFRQAREARADTFEFEGRTYLADLPVNREGRSEGGKTEKSEFPDLTGDGKVTRADVLHGRGVFQEGGEVPVDTYPNIPPEEMDAVKASQLPDEQMEDAFIDYVLNEALQPEEQTYLMNALENDPQLSMIFDKVVGTASEFTGSGEVKGPGTGVSDSIPARLSDGEFVFTRKATDQLGADNLQRIMDDAERAYDGGMMRVDREDEQADTMNKVMMSANQMPSLNVRQR